MILDANGRASVWLDPTLSYKFVLRDSNEVEIYTTDGVIGILTADAVTTVSIQNLAVTTPKIAVGAVTLDKMANLPANSMLGNNTGSLATPIALTASQIRTFLNLSTTTPTIQRFTSGSGTYTTPAGVKWIKIKMVGGGGGGAGSGTAAGTAAGAGGNTTFGTSLLTANGGSGGFFGNDPPSGSGGSVTVNSPAVTIAAVTGVRGQGAGVRQTSNAMAGGNGAVTAFGGGGGGGNLNEAGIPASSNTGSGGGGAGNPTTGTAYCGSGGCSGGYIEASISSPSATYSYSVGAGGTAGGAGTSGFVGGAGGAGVIVVEEYY